jgi:hypothetical protein
MLYIYFCTANANQKYVKVVHCLFFLLLFYLSHLHIRACLYVLLIAVYITTFHFSSLASFIIGYC